MAKAYCLIISIILNGLESLYKKNWYWSRIRIRLILDKQKSSRLIINGIKRHKKNKNKKRVQMRIFSWLSVLKCLYGLMRTKTKFLPADFFKVFKSFEVFESPQPKHVETYLGWDFWEPLLIHKKSCKYFLVLNLGTYFFWTFWSQSADKATIHSLPCSWVL